MSRTRSVAGVGWVVAILLVVLWASPADAHHAMDGKLPATFAQGLLSGLAHPVIGPDHLAFIVAIGIAAALVPAGMPLIAAFIAASLAGVLVHAGKLDVPVSEQIVAGSVVVAGALIVAGRAGSQPIWLALAAFAGLFHGYAFGETIIGAERAVVGAYLIGIAIVAAVIAFGTMQATRQILKIQEGRTTHVRTAGAIVGCVGLAMLVGSFA